MKKIAFILIIIISCSSNKKISTDNISGEYSWKSIYGVGSTINLKDDKTFEFKWIEGLVSGTTYGNWSIIKNHIILNSHEQPKPNFEIIETEFKKNDSIALKIYDENSKPIQHIECSLETDGKLIGYALTNSHGIAIIKKADANHLKIQILGFKTIILKYNPTISSYILKMSEEKHQVYFTNKVLISKNNKLYDYSIKTNKHNKNYYIRNNSNSD